jgi:hypothetical protein
MAAVEGVREPRSASASRSSSSDFLPNLGFSILVVPLLSTASAIGAATPKRSTTHQNFVRGTKNTQPRRSTNAYRADCQSTKEAGPRRPASFACVRV